MCPRSPWTGGQHEWYVVTLGGAKAVGCTHCGAITLYYGGR